MSQDGSEAGALIQQAVRSADPATGLRAVARLRQITDAIELEQVEAALRSGMSWADIAVCLGVSRQAAHKRLRHRVPPELVRGRRGKS
ncbi:hypothetical protein [Serinicoccus marinus]|uniref:hypothetical protein n=1 Tax=Serinicoccus marinus TaxID=247333 RepID=UPI0003B4F74B|nr:hypothetical protein [Serinicoccus marinus]